MSLQINLNSINVPTNEFRTIASNHNCSLELDGHPEFVKFVGLPNWDDVIRDIEDLKLRLGDVYIDHLGSDGKPLGFKTKSELTIQINYV